MEASTMKELTELCAKARTAVFALEKALAEKDEYDAFEAVYNLRDISYGRDHTLSQRYVYTLEGKRVTRKEYWTAVNKFDNLLGVGDF